VDRQDSVPKGVCEVVLSTLIEAADADYRLAVIGDGCADLDSAIHDCLI
jgi:nicotinamidase-related amidase